MNIEVKISNRGRRILIYQSYEYIRKPETNTTTHWICRHYCQIKCSSLVITSEGEIRNTPKDDFCNLKPRATETKQAKNKMREKAKTTTNYMAIASTLQEIHKNVATQMNLPPQETIVKSIERYKKISNALLHIPHRKNFKFAEKIRDFVAFGKRKDEPEKFIIFALTEMLLLLVETTRDLWFADGTFKQCPDMFNQMNTIHPTIGGYNSACG